MNANDLYDSIARDGWGRRDDITIHTEGSRYAHLSCPIESASCMTLVQLANDLAELLMSETTNNDASEVLINAKADLTDGSGFYHVTAIVTDYLS